MFAKFFIEEVRVSRSYTNEEEIVTELEFINETVRDLNKIESDTDTMNTIQDAISIIDNYREELLRKKIAP